ncbi:MAG: hypothetical protein UY41_C0050G0005 [Candidatus Moranbacteria bacterium GW2011_GWE1_49_15]|nr:MAG: hypothetical protein UX75_C0054G0005 [Candidatus Moranbacteria bacterium GW2011_GWE2_47_10]KKW05481.1 MAG: hypothetical protein UY41_C0050G0005 [Candidatus Moranbacteria bacterium GW2011_GWE1_49_15]HBP01226.1 hypothetical protein [Candidatus Moranbacteria bacterium]
MILSKKSQNLILAIFLAISILLFVFALRGEESFEVFREAVQRNFFYGAFIFLLLEVISIVVAPVSTIFLIPVASDIFGPFLTALLSVLGWTIGSVIAFAIARRFGRPVLEKIVEPEKLERYRNYITPDAEFLTVLLLRVMLPVDVVSYAVGLFTLMHFRKYLLATVIGITPFSFIYSYGGGAFLMGDYQRFSFIVLGSAVFLLAVIFIFRKLKK